jgi:hypothetical protein
VGTTAPGKNAFPGGVFLRLAALTLDWAGIDRARRST